MRSAEKFCHIRHADTSRRRFGVVARQRGLSLVELMVALTIGLLVVLAAVGSLIMIRGSSLAMSDSAALEQQGSLVMLQISQQLSQAGSYNAYATGQNPDANTVAAPATPVTILGGSPGTIVFDTRDAGVTSAYPKISIYGEDGGASPDTLYISYVAPNDGSPASGCAGQTNTALTGGAARVVSIFTVNTATNSLTCSTSNVGVVVSGASPIAAGVADMHIRYLTLTGTDPSSATVTYQKAGDVTDWSAVNGVQICLEMVGDYHTDTGQITYGTGGDCKGNSTSPADGKLHRIVRRTFYLRNSV